MCKFILLRNRFISPVATSAVFLFSSFISPESYKLMHVQRLYCVWCTGSRSHEAAKISRSGKKVQAKVWLKILLSPDLLSGKKFRTFEKTGLSKIYWVVSISFKFLPDKLVKIVFIWVLEVSWTEKHVELTMSVSEHIRLFLLSSVCAPHFGNWINAIFTMLSCEIVNEIDITQWISFCHKFQNKLYEIFSHKQSFIAKHILGLPFLKLIFPVTS